MLHIKNFLMHRIQFTMDGKSCSGVENYEFQFISQVYSVLENIYLFLYRTKSIDINFVNIQGPSFNVLFFPLLPLLSPNMIYCPT